MTWLPAFSMKELLDNLKSARVLQTPRVYQVMMKYDRALFCSAPAPYQDSPQSIGYGATISAPHMHAHALELLKDKLVPGARALDVGSGSGILTAYMAEMVSPNGLAVGVDHIEQLVEKSIENVNKANPDLIKNGQIKLMVADGRSGHFEDGPFDVIHVGASCPEEPLHLVEQLKPGGVLVAPVGKVRQVFREYRKSTDGQVSKKDLLDVIYVPLTEKSSQLSGFRY